MNRIFNNPDFVVEDAVRGYLKAHPDILAATDNARVLRRPLAPQKDKVGIVTGGGSGHEPAFLGYVGDGMVDAVAVGEIFSSPSAKAFHDAFVAADGGRGVACLYGNYAGDNMNVKLAVKQAAKHDLTVKTVVANDDVPSAPKDEIKKRRGVAGEILMWKAGGARADEGADLDEVIASAQKAIDSTRSIGIGLSACTIPAVGKPNFSIEDGHMEVGIGHHGEPGVAVMPIKPAREIADMMLDHILPDLPFEKDDDVALLVSGLGATPIMELYILYDRLAEVIEARGMKTRHLFIGNYFTSLEMQGVTLTMMRLDSELDRLMSAPARSLGLTRI
nr:dihydroxyacetone kinase subunit DhaK [uncultured Cohaesibacter sp.]